MKTKFFLFLITVFIVFDIYSQEIDPKEINQLCSWLSNHEQSIDSRIDSLSKNKTLNWNELLEWGFFYSNIGVLIEKDLKEKACDFIQKAIYEISSKGLKNTKDLCRAVHNYLHQNLLVDYQEDQHRLDKIFSSGSYNCISSVGLYLILATALNIKVYGVLTKGHSYILVYDNNEIVHIETTDKTSGVRIYEQSDYKPYNEWEIVTPIYLYSFILRNRFASSEKKGEINLNLLINLMEATQNVAEEIPFEQKPDKILLNRTLYYSFILWEAGKKKESLALLEATSCYFSADDEWNKAVFATVNNLAVEFINSTEHSLENAEEMLAFVFSKGKQHSFDSKEIDELLSMIVNNTAIDISKKYGAKAALEFIKSTIENYGEITRVVDLFHFYQKAKGE